MTGPPSPSVSFIRLLLPLLPLAAIVSVAGSAPPLPLAPMSSSLAENDADMAADVDDRFFVAEDDNLLLLPPATEEEVCFSPARVVRGERMGDAAACVGRRILEGKK